MYTFPLLESQSERLFRVASASESEKLKAEMNYAALGAASKRHNAAVLPQRRAFIGGRLMKRSSGYRVHPLLELVELAI